MKICIDADYLKVPTSGMPMRGMILELLKTRKKDDFIFFVRKGLFSNSQLNTFFYEVKQLNKNIKIVEDKKTSRVVNLLVLLKLNSLCSLPVMADVYLSLDIYNYGVKNKPMINVIADFSSINKGEVSSLNLIGKWIRRSLYKTMVLQSNHIVAISHYTLNEMHKKSPITKFKSSVIYNGISSEWFSASKYSNFDNEKYLLWWGFVSKRKNLEGLLSAYKELLTECDSIHMMPEIHIVANNIASVANIVNQSELLKNKIKFFNSLNLQNLIQKVDGSSGVLFPSYHEGFGLPIIEAFARGKQVLTSDITALKEVSKGKAIYCNPYDTSTIKAGLNELIYHADKYSNKLERTMIAQEFNYKKAADSFSQLINRIYDTK